MIDSLWQQLLFSSMRKRKMTKVMTKSSKADSDPPLRQIVRKHVVCVWMAIGRVGHHIEDKTSKMHNPE